MNQIHLALDIARIVLVYVVYGSYGISYLFMASKILIRNPNRLSYLLGGFYISSGVGVIVNFVYTLIFIEIVLMILYFLTIFLLLLSLIFLFLFVFTLKKSEILLSPRFIVGIITIYACFEILICFIPNGVEISIATDWRPIWSIAFFLSVFIIGNVAIIPTLFYSIKMYLQFSDMILKKKWKYFLIGIMGYFFLFYGNIINLVWGDPLVRQIWSYMSIQD
jgi:hypothetical protein